MAAALLTAARGSLAAPPRHAPGPAATRRPRPIGEVPARQPSPAARRSPTATPARRRCRKGDPARDRRHGDGGAPLQRPSPLRCPRPRRRRWPPRRWPTAWTSARRRCRRTMGARLAGAGLCPQTPASVRPRCSRPRCRPWVGPARRACRVCRVTRASCSHFRAHARRAAAVGPDTGAFLSALGWRRSSRPRDVDAARGRGLPGLRTRPIPPPRSGTIASMPQAELPSYVSGNAVVNVGPTHLSAQHFGARRRSLRGGALDRGSRRSAPPARRGPRRTGWSASSPSPPSGSAWPWACCSG